ncbi:hypothetical protein [Pedobacter panaciterrae]
MSLGYSSLILGFAWMVGGFIGKATINKPFLKKMIVNLGLQILFVLLMFISIQFISSIYTLIFFAFLIHVTAGYIFNNYFTFCLGRFPKNAGIASGLTDGVTYVIVSFLSYSVISFLPAKDEHNLNSSYLLLAVISGIVMFVIFKLTKKEELATA